MLIRARRKVAALMLAAPLLLLAGCAGLVDLPLPPLPTPTHLPQPTSTPTATPVLTSTPTVIPSPTPTFAVAILTPMPGNSTAREPVLGDRVASTDHLDFYAQPDNYWAGRMADIAPAIEGELHRVAGRLHADIPENRVTISFQDPSTSPHVRGMNCPARGLYVNPADHGPILTIFADEETGGVQVLAVAAHELAHYLSFAEFGEGGDIILTEGVATWASLDTWSAWQGWPSFDAALREYLADNIFLTLDETLTFDPAVARELGLSDCFALRDLRYNEWASFVDYVIDRYGFDAIGDLWKATLDDSRASRDDRRARRVPTTSAGGRFIVPGDELSAQPDRAPTVDYAGVLGKDLQALEQDWLQSVYVEHAQ